MPSDDHDGSSRVTILDDHHDAPFAIGNPADEAQLLAEAQSTNERVAGEAFVKLFLPYQPKLVRLIGSKLQGAVDEIHDIEQDTIERAWRRLRRPPKLVLEPGKPYWAFLQRIAQNRIIDHWNKCLGHIKYVGQMPYLSSLGESQVPSVPTSARISPCLPSIDDEPGELALDAILRKLMPSSIQKMLPVGASRIPVRPPSPDTLDEIDIHRYDRGGHTPLVRAVRLLPEQYRSCFILAHHQKMKQRQIADLLGIPPGTVGWTISRAKQIVAEVLASIWWEEDGYTPAQIAADLDIRLEDVEQYVNKGRLRRRNGSDFDV